MTYEDFNKITDLRPYLLHHPNREMIETSCLHFLGDDAQEWWARRKWQVGKPRTPPHLFKERKSENEFFTNGWGQKCVRFPCGWVSPVEDGPQPEIAPLYTEDEVKEIHARGAAVLQKQYETTDDEWLKQCIEAVLMPDVFEERKAQGRIVDRDNRPIKFFKLDPSQCPNEFFNKP